MQLTIQDKIFILTQVTHILQKISLVFMIVLGSSIIINLAVPSVNVVAVKVKMDPSPINFPDVEEDETDTDTYEERDPTALSELHSVLPDFIMISFLRDQVLNYLNDAIFSIHRPPAV